MSQALDITPHESILEKIGFASFTVTQSLSELVANCLDAKRDGAPAHIEIFADSGRIVVADDGRGMTEEILKAAIRMAWPMKTVLGDGTQRKSEFGLGMKTACASLGRWWRLQTIAPGSKDALEVTFDLEAFSRGGSGWTVNLDRVSPASIALPGGAHSGTVITVKKLRVMPNDVVIREELARAYAPHLRGEDQIALNGAPLELVAPALQDGTRIEIDEVVQGIHLHGWGALLSGKGSLTNYGFHWYRKGQLILAFDKSFIPRHPTYRKIIGELHADKMPVNFNKHGFETTSPEWKQAIEFLENHVEPLLEQARKRTKLELPDAWTDGQTKSGLEAMTQSSGDVVVRVIDGKDIPTDFIVPPVGSREQEASEDVPTDGVTRAPLVVDGNSHRWRHQFSSLGPEGPICDYAMDGDDEILVVSNVDSPFADVVQERSVLAMLNTADAIMRWLIEVKEFEFTKAVAFRDRWLVTASARLKEVH